MQITIMGSEPFHVDDGTKEDGTPHRDIRIIETPIPTPQARRDDSTAHLNQNESTAQLNKNESYRFLNIDESFKILEKADSHVILKDPLMNIEESPKLVTDNSYRYLGKAESQKKLEIIPIKNPYGGSDINSAIDNISPFLRPKIQPEILSPSIKSPLGPFISTMKSNVLDSRIIRDLKALTFLEFSNEQAKLNNQELNVQGL